MIPENTIVKLTYDSGYVAVKTFDRTHHGSIRFLIDPEKILRIMNDPMGGSAFDADCGNFVTIAQKIAADEAAADAAHASAQPYTYQYRVDAEWLAENAAYIDVDGVIQNAYVDSDILGGGAGSVQTGFSGGGMQ